MRAGDRRVRAVSGGLTAVDGLRGPVRRLPRGDDHGQALARAERGTQYLGRTEFREDIVT
jgi:hypothetical protein